MDSTEFEAMIRRLLEEWVALSSSSLCTSNNFAWCLSHLSLLSNVLTHHLYFHYTSHPIHCTSPQSAANTMIANLPELKRLLFEALDVVFIPKQIASQFILAVALESSMVSSLLLLSALLDLSVVVLMVLIMSSVKFWPCIDSQPNNTYSPLHITTGNSQSTIPHSPPLIRFHLHTLSSHPPTPLPTTHIRFSRRVDGSSRADW